MDVNWTFHAHSKSRKNIYSWCAIVISTEINLQEWNWNIFCWGEQAERFCGARDKVSIWDPWWSHIYISPRPWGPRPPFGAPTLWNAVSLHFEGNNYCSKPTAVRYVIVFNLRYVKNLKLKHFRRPLSSRGPGASCPTCPPLGGPGDENGIYWHSTSRCLRALKGLIPWSI